MSNKGQWDSLLTYLEIATTGDNDIISLPPNIDAVLRINLNGNPSFARDRMWEFTLDGPGSNDARIGFQWEDRGDVLVQNLVLVNENTTGDATKITQLEADEPAVTVQPPYIAPAGRYNAIFPMLVRIYSYDNDGGIVIYTTDGSDPTWFHGTHGGNIVNLTLTSETTVKAIVARDRATVSTIVTEFYTDSPPPPPPGPPPPGPPPPPPAPPPTASQQRVIRLSQKSVAVRALVRLRPMPISSKNDWIPLDSKMAILLMLKSLESFRRGTPQDFQLGQQQEEQALKFLAEEQKSRNIFSELSQSMDNPPMVGYTYHANNLVVVADIYDEASMICGGVGKNYVFDRISEAIEVLANKGQWDGMTAYMDMVPNSDIIGLPRQVEIPIKINIDSKPSLSRNRMFEFSINGPGSELDELTTLTWEDQGTSSLIVPITNPATLQITGSTADTGKNITIVGTDVYDKEQNVTQQLLTPHIGTSIRWKTISRISKDVTQAPVSIISEGVLVAFLYPDETEAEFRVIKLNKPASAIKMMFRKASLKVSSTDDIIPLKSRSAVLLMLRALQTYKQPNLAPEAVAMAQQLEAQALKFLQEEEQSRLAYIQASAKEQMPALGVNTNSKGVVLAGDVYDDAADIFGPIGRQRLFDKITDGMEMLANKSQWDGMDGYVDIVTDQRGYITLPRKVEMIIGMNFWRTPAQIRNKWYEFHMNGLGTDPVIGDYYDDLGEYPLVNEPTQALKLFARTGQTSDTNTKIRAYGYDVSGLWIKSNENGEFVDGELVPVNLIISNSPSAVQVRTTLADFAQVSRITKDSCNMPIELFGTGNLILPLSTGTQPPNVQFLAQYDSDETEPLFRRIRVPTWVTWARIRYRSSTMKITKMSDPLNMRSKTALVTMMQALKALQSGQLDVEEALERKAVQLISEEQMSRSPAQTFDLQFDQDTSFADRLQGRY